MREFRTYGSVRGVPGNRHPYRNYPEEVFGAPLTTRQFLVHLHGHFNYHLGQIDYLRRILAEGKPIRFASL